MLGAVKNKIRKFWKGLPVLARFFLVLAILLTIFRIVLAMKIPLHIQAAAVYDDRMLVNYSRSMLSGKWLGEFNQFSLAKGASYAIFLAINYLLGLPYSFTLVFLYIVAVVLFCIALSRLIKNKTFLYILYSIMLYSPVMFHDENVQKVYRGGVIVIFALLIVAAVIGIYTRIEEKNRQVLKWAILATVALVFFWFLKEDSIWILPFVVGGIALATIRAMRMKLSKKQRWGKVLIACLPLVGLIVGIFGYKVINYAAYGEFAVTDRQGTYFKEVITDLIHIEGEGRSKDNWVTRDMLEKAYAVSPTLSQVKEDINRGYAGWAKEDGEIEGDIVFWEIKDAVAEAGFYESGASANEFYRKVHEELTAAFENGGLEKNGDFYISAVAKGINAEEIPEFLQHVSESLNNVVAYEYNEAGMYAATGDAAGIARFNELTMSQYIAPELDVASYRLEGVAVKIANKLVDIYQIAGKVMFYGAMAVLVMYTAYVIYWSCRKKLKRAELDLYLIVLGLTATCSILFFGTTFFCRFLSQRKVYDYASPMLPILLAVEVILFYVLMKGVKMALLKWRKK